MNKVILFLSLILCVPVVAQKKPEDQNPRCPLRLDQSPELRGFRLGMTQAAVLARLPGVTIEKPDKFGLARLRLSIIDSTSLIKSSPRDKGVQTDMVAGPNEGSTFVIDSSHFPFLKGVRKIQMRIIEGRLAGLQISYDDEIKWESIDQFIETISTNLKLPKEWQVPEASDSGSNQKELSCEGFVIAANLAGDPTDIHAGAELILQDLAAWNAMSKRQNDLTDKAKQAEDQKRKTFKP
ncbi:MAG TPA: hypothetical protein VHP99_09030 [Pyrinomonadaceae bacterium]|nr:hypothetical protein [Pyrinomonadaceae bacterium]